MVHNLVPSDGQVAKNLRVFCNESKRTLLAHMGYRFIEAEH